jgi:hypothetical protein
MDHQSDSELVIALSDRLTPVFKIGSWSFDKGYWHPDNRALLEMVVPQVIMPKKGKCNKEESEREGTKGFKKTAQETQCDRIEYPLVGNKGFIPLSG